MGELSTGFHFLLKHKLGVQNRMVDTLNKTAKLLGVLRIEVVGFDALKDLCANDLDFASILWEVQSNNRVDF